MELPSRLELIGDVAALGFKSRFGHPVTEGLDEKQDDLDFGHWMDAPSLWPGLRARPVWARATGRPGAAEAPPMGAPPEWAIVAHNRCDSVTAAG